MTKKFSKDKWILHAIKSRYIIPREDGTVLRCKRASDKGELLSDEYEPIKFRVHKATGRVYANMTWMGFTKSILLNRVIALRFLPNPLNLPQVNHIDGNKEHNYLRQPTPELRAKWGEYQLEWSTGSDNEKHAHRTGLKSGRGSQNSNAKLSAGQVIEIRRQHASDGASIPELMKRFGIARSTVVNILNRTTWQHI